MLNTSSWEGSRAPRPRLVTLCDQASTPPAPGLIQPRQGWMPWPGSWSSLPGRWFSCVCSSEVLSSSL